MFASFHSAFTKSNYLVSKHHLNHILVSIPVHKNLNGTGKMLFIDWTNKIVQVINTLKCEISPLGLSGAI